MRTMSTTAVLLPGSGSDEIFVTAAFAQPLAAAGSTLVAPRPQPARLVEAAVEALDSAADAAAEPVLVGGVSFGAHVATSWAIANQDRCAGVLAALPAWIGTPDSAPAAVAAATSARLIRTHGLPHAVSLAVDGVAEWLATELRRAWPRQGPALADGLTATAHHPAPTAHQLAQLDRPVGIVTCTDDAVHPHGVGAAWAAALPNADLTTTTWEVAGTDPGVLGAQAVRSWQRAAD